MLFLHQIGSVRIGEVVRYSVTYTPAHDRILPAPEYLYLKVRNTSNSALRAAFVHGPYTLYVDAYPAHYDPNEKFAQPRKYGVPEFEPMLKAGGSWTCRLVVPEHVRLDAGTGHSGMDVEPPSVSWIINVSSQVIFSTSAAVHFEMLLARDPKSLESGGGITTGIPAILGGSGDAGSGSGKGGNGQAQFLQPGKVTDYQRGRDGRHPDQPRGVFSRAIRMRLEDTNALWNKPELPGHDRLSTPSCFRTAANDFTLETGGRTLKKQQKQQKQQREQKAPERSSEANTQATQQMHETVPTLRSRKQPKKVHLVILTHGLHSNLGGDMLYIKESIDVAAKQAKHDRKVRLEKERAQKAEAQMEAGRPADDLEAAADEDEDDEEVIVRGYSGNATRTERGIKYLGKRLARYILSITYPDQPYLPASKAAAEKKEAAMNDSSAARAAGGSATSSHKHSTVQKVPTESHREYKYTKISFVAHSLGGLVQTYAVAYIQKHSPQFFDVIEPINFVAMASPFLGLNHENPLYVKFALDFGLVGRTGQDLGLTWRAPTIARNGWSSLVGSLGDSAHKKVLGESQPESKPLLRILPTGPAHTALKKFRNRTVYSNVVNDGIVPLRTSCLLFLDWQGLDHVEKARREAGLVETVVGFGWAELVGNNTATQRDDTYELKDDDEEDGDEGDEGTTTGAARDDVHGADLPHARRRSLHEVPQPSTNATQEDNRISIGPVAVSSSFDLGERQQLNAPLPTPEPGKPATAATGLSNPFSNFFNSLFKTGTSGEEPASTVSVPTPQSPESSPKSKSPTHTHTIKSPLHSSSTGSKQNMIYQRSQTLRSGDWPTTPGSATSSKSRVTTGHELGDDASSGSLAGGLSAPPRTSFFESATDIINPKLPPVEFLIDPSKRPRTIFHDRIYHPSDIPAPPLKRRATGNLALRRLSFQQRSKTSLSIGSGGSGRANSTISNNASTSSTRASSPYQERAPAMTGLGAGSVEHQDSGLSVQDYDDQIHTNPDRDPDEVVDTSSIKVEEKIARAYHRGLSWRKVLVKLEPDAHNNMVVRRTFANAFGWPVVKHMVDAHFSDSVTARMRNEDEDSAERARPLNEAPDEHGAEIIMQKNCSGPLNNPQNEADVSSETEDQHTDLPKKFAGGLSQLPLRPKSKSPSSLRDSNQDNATWADGDWNDSCDESDGPDGGDEDHQALNSEKQTLEAKSALPSLREGLSVTAMGGTKSAPLSAGQPPLASPPGDGK